MLPPAELPRLGLLNRAVVQLAGRVAGTEPPRLFRTIGHRPALLRRWLLFAGTLMPGGSLPKVDTELVILAVAALLECDYEWHHHAPRARDAGLSPAAIQSLRSKELDGALFSARHGLLLHATREQLNDGRVANDRMERLRAMLGDAGTVELLLLIGHYQMLAGFIASCGVEPDRPREGL